VAAAAATAGSGAFASTWFARRCSSVIPAAACEPASVNVSPPPASSVRASLNSQARDSA